MLLSPDLLSWSASLLGSPIRDTLELTGGASRNSFVLTTDAGSKAFLRLDAGDGPLSGTEFTLAREYGVLEFLQGTAVPVARTFGFSERHDAILMEFVPGVTSYQQQFSGAEEARLQHQLIAAVVELQRLDPSPLRGLGEHAGAPLGEAVPRDLETWSQLCDDHVTPRDPMLEFALRWLAHDVPDAAMPAVLVHGDLGPGNFLIENGDVAALIDWEMVRVGHPLEDLACIIARGLGAPFGRPRDHIATYERLTGSTVDRRKLDYALCLVLTRWTIAISMALSRPTAQQNVPMLFAFRQINQRSLIEAIARSYGIEADAAWRFEVAPRREALVPAGYGREVLGVLAESDGIPAAERYRLRGVADMIGYLQSFIGYGPERYRDEERRRAAELLGNAVVDRDPADAIADHARSVDPTEAAPLIRYLLWRNAREHAIMAASLNERADNVIAY